MSICRRLSALFLLVVFSVAAMSALALADDAMVKRGEYLMKVSGCHDCHSPKVYTPQGVPMPDPKRLLSGHPAGLALPEYDKSWTTPGKWVLLNEHFTAFVGPWGVTYSANLTPDKDTGTGLWTEAIFIKALRSGKHMGEGRPIMPPMPWPMIGQMTDEDLGAIFAYLQSIPAVSNKVPEPQLNPPPPGH